MNKHWRKVKLGKYIFINPDGIGSDYRYDEIEYIDISSVGSGELLGTTRYKLKSAPSRARRLVKERDTILSTVRPNRRSFLYIKNQPLNIVVSTGFAVLRAREGIDPRYLYYYVTNQPFTDYLSNHAKGAAYPAVDTETITRAEIDIPDIDAQHRIASILSAYDDMIENNNRRIKIIEQMAQMIYREWFVNFRFPEHEKVKMVDSKLGRMPEGWEIKRLGELCEYVSDGDWIETKDQSGTDYRLLQISNIGVGEFVETGNFRYISQATFDRLNCTEIMPGHILVSRMPAPIGRAWLATQMPWKMITAVDVAIIKTNPTKYSPLLCLYMLNSPESLALAAQQATGTTRARITRRLLNERLIIVPQMNIQEQFDAFAKSTYTQITDLRNINSLLRQTRDLLLPKLVGGEIEV